jgi:hypothetical protein
LFGIQSLGMLPVRVAPLGIQSQCRSNKNFIN